MKLKPNHFNYKPLHRVSITLLMAFSVGCQQHQRGFNNPIELSDATQLWDQDQAAKPITQKWWQAFDDPQLDTLQDTAMAQNYDLAALRERLNAARAVTARQQAGRMPQIDYTGSASQSRERVNDWDAEDRVELGIAGTYDLDLWGGIQADIDTAVFDALTAEAELEAAGIMLSAQVATTWYALLEQQAQSKILSQQILTNEQVLRVVKARFAGGAVRASDVLRQQRLLESTREQLALVRSDIEVLHNALMVLTGQLPEQEMNYEIVSLPPLPPKPALGIPADLIERRPDIRASLYAIRAADEQVAVAVANQYPSVSISLDATTLESQISNLFDDWASTLSIDLFGPIFDAGQRGAEIERSQAVKAELVNIYASRILDSLRQVLDAVSRESARDEQIARIIRQLDLAEQTSERLNREYLNGDISYIDVLDALTTEQRLQRDLIQARSLRIADRIRLHEALAGPFEDVDSPASDHGENQSVRLPGNKPVKGNEDQ